MYASHSARSRLAGSSSAWRMAVPTSSAASVPQRLSSASRSPSLLPKCAYSAPDVRPAASATASAETPWNPLRANRSAAASTRRSLVSALRSCWVWATPYLYRTSYINQSPCSAPLEHGGPLLEEGLRTLSSVLRTHDLHADLELALEGVLLAQGVAGQHRGLDAADRQRAVGRDAIGELPGPGQRLAVRHDVPDEPDLAGSLATHGLAGEHHLHGVGVG